MFDREEEKLNNVKHKYEGSPLPNEKIDQAIFAGIRKARNKKKRFQFWTNSFLSAAVIAVVFVITFHTITPPKKNTSSLPKDDKLAELIRNDKGLKAAVANDYVQNINRSDEHEGIKVVLDSVIVDEEQLIMFYHFESKQVNDAHIIVDNYYFEKENGKHLKLGSFSTQQGVDFDNGKSPIYRCDIGLGENLSDSQLTLTVELKKRIGEDDEKTVKYDSKWKIPFTLDQHKIARKEVITLNKTVTVENQKILIKKISFLPTRVGISVELPSDNTKQIFDLQDLRLVDEHGETWPIIASGTIGSGAGDKKTYYLQSDYFAKSKKLYIAINTVRALDKDQLLVKVDPKNQKVLQAPKDGQLYKVTSGSRLSFYFKNLDKDYDSVLTMFDSYIDAQGKKHLPSYSNHYSNEEGEVLEIPYDKPIPTKPITLKLLDYPAYIHGDIKIRIK